MKIGIIGGGLSGVALAHKLSKKNHVVTVIEGQTQLGGLATYEDHGPFVYDRYYHVILPSDRHLISFLRDLELDNELRWETTLTGFYVDESMHSMSNAWEFLRFPPLSLISKIRLALTILYCSRIENWRRLEKITVEEFLTRLSGRATYNKMWKPLLLAKLGESYERVSAVFIWTYIKRMFSARDSSASKEQLGHVRGGYKTVFDRLDKKICEHGGVIRVGTTVESIDPGSSGSGVDLQIDGSRENFDKVIFTGPVSVLNSIADRSLVAVEDSGKDVEYLGVICMALVTHRPLTSFYVLNIADHRIPFTGVIGMSNILDRSETAGLHLSYLPKYVLSNDDELRRPEDELQEEFLEGIRTMFPGFSESDVVSCRIHRAFKVQPLQVMNFSELIPKPKSLHPDFYVHNTAQFVNNTLNNNEVIRAVEQFLEDFGGEFTAQHRTIPGPVS